MSDADYMGTQFDRFDGLESRGTFCRLSARYHTERPDATGVEPIGLRFQHVAACRGILSRSGTSSQVPADRLRRRDKALHHVPELFHFMGF
jgi:hypothetical protein